MKQSLKLGRVLSGAVVMLLLGLPVANLYAENSKPVSTSAIKTQVVNINTASSEQLQEALKGIGEKRAVAIVQYRQNHGPYTNKKQLLAVKGVGEAILAKNSTSIVLK